ncbi:MAG TPA: response regulator transcription factor [Opitutaceae bacterium]|nr:response regulator transcription factor [Opitutaceae bacterium]
MKYVLLIEDNADMRRNLATILEMEGYTVVTCANGRAGLDSARKRMPDIILCDVMMPELDGYEVLQQLRAEPAFDDTPFIFLTAKGEKRDIRSGMNLGADDYLTKPVTATDLLAAIETRLKRSANRAPAEFKPDFSSSGPLEKLGLTPREAEVLLWVAQGKSNADIAMILETSVHTVKKHLQNLFEKIGVETRNGATFRALEILSNRRDLR